MIGSVNGEIIEWIINGTSTIDKCIELMNKYRLKPDIFIYNCKQDMVKHLLMEGVLDPNKYVHDLCSWGNEKHIEIIKLLYDHDRFDKLSRDDQDRTVEECIKQNRLLRHRDFLK